MGIFNNCNNVEDVKKKFRELIKENHPDNGGDATTAARILEEYRKALDTFEKCNAKHTTANNACRNETEKAEDLSNDIADAAAVACGLDGVIVELVGAWLWVTGNTYPVRDELKGAGFKWASKKKAWYFHAGEYHRHGRTEKDLDTIKAKYGSATISYNPRPRIA